MFCSMKKLSLFIVCLFILGLSSRAQFTSSSRSTDINVKFISKDETMEFAKGIGDLTMDQTERVYLSNLNINRKYLSATNVKLLCDRNSSLYLKYTAEKEMQYKKILTTEQYHRYEEALKNRQLELVNSSLKVYEQSGGNANAENAISSTR